MKTKSIIIKINSNIDERIKKFCIEKHIHQYQAMPLLIVSGLRYYEDMKK